MFSPDDLSGKATCKAALQQAVGLRQESNIPIIACVSRLVKHKGFELVASAIHDIMAMDVQMVVLGTGDWNFEEAFRHAQAQYPGRFSANILYSGALSTAIYGGADLFLMPSVAEPCGLSQMIAMRYGTLPVVRETGGLKDSVRPNGTEQANGFSFADINAHDMTWVLGEAVDLYHNNKEAWAHLQHNAMTADFSWNQSAQDYLQVYYWVTGFSAPAPVEEPTPVEEPAPVEEPTPAEEPAPTEEPTPTEEPAPAEAPANSRRLPKRPLPRRAVLQKRAAPAAKNPIKKAL